MKSLLRFLGYSKPYWKLMGLALIASLARMAMPICMPLYVGKVVDNIIAPCLAGTFDGAEAWRKMALLTGLLTALLVVHIVVTIGRIHLPQRASAATVRDIRYKLFAHIQRLSLGFHSSRPSGAIASRVINDVNMAQQAVELGVIMTCQSILQIVTIGAIMLYLDWSWALIAFTAAPLFIVVTWLISKPLRNAGRRMLESTETMSGHVHERFGMIREVQSFGTEQHEQQRVWQYNEQLRSHSVRHSLWSGILMAGGESSRYLGLIVVLLYGVYQVAHGKPGITPGVVTMFYLYTDRLFVPAEWLASAYGQLQTAAAASARIFEFFDTEPKITNRHGAVPLKTDGAPSVCFKNVRFSYPDTRPEIVLKDLCFEAPGGSTVALVGPSGGGKSTALSLLPRFYDVAGGNVLVDGCDVRNLTIDSLRKTIGIVPQEPVLFTGTILENIEYGRPGSSRLDVMKAATAANAHQFIIEQAAGYDTAVGERGVGLSGGQLQRVAIARAFLKDPRILIMDEPTSNLDAVSESLILSAIQQLAKGRTTFIVAHRLSMARNADMILVMDQGQLVEQGTHDELLARRGVYSDLWERQIGKD